MAIAKIAKGQYLLRGQHVGMYDFPLLDCCEALHSSVCGSGDPLPSATALLYHDFLGARLVDWRVSCGDRFERYEESVKALCLAAIEEYEASDMKRDEAEPA